MRRCSLSLRRRASRSHFTTTVLACLGLASVVAASVATDSRESEKAATLYNVITFTEWPARSFSSEESPFVIGIVGEAPIAPALEAMVARETPHRRPLVVQRIRSFRETRKCQVLFVAPEEVARWRAARRDLDALPVLTVSDADKFAEQGGMVQFVVDRSRLRLIVNLGAARAAGLAISSKVLRLAQVLGEDKP